MHLLINKQWIESFIRLYVTESSVNISLIPGHYHHSLGHLFHTTNEHHLSFSVTEWHLYFLVQDSLPICGYLNSTDSLFFNQYLNSFHYLSTCSLFISKQPNVCICVALFLTWKHTQFTSWKSKVKGNFINISHIIYLIKNH